MTKLIITNKNKCVGCRMCELICSYYHDQLFNPEVSRIKVEKNEHTGIDSPQICLQCSNAPCMEVCPLDAIYEKDGVIYVNESECNGCGLCVQNCPYDSINIHQKKGVAIKCDLCSGEPQCVKWCPVEIIKTKDDSVASLISKYKNKKGIIDE